MCWQANVNTPLSVNPLLNVPDENAWPLLIDDVDGAVRRDERFHLAKLHAP